LAGDGSKYIQNFRQVIFEKPDVNDRSATIRYSRRVLAYRALLAKAEFDIPTNITAVTKGFFNAKLIEALDQSNSDEQVSYKSAAACFNKPNPNWKELASAFESLYKFMTDSKDDYKKFEAWYITERPKASGDPWADEDLKKILEMFSRPNGARQIGKVRNQHTPSTTSDYAEEIYKHLKAGRLVIIDQSSGDPEINQSSADRIMWYVFRQNQELFRQGETNLPEILIYLEEAHNLLPSDSDMDLKNVWVRTAKEGAKYHLGIVYA
jgi:hypothetical protein